MEKFNESLNKQNLYFYSGETLSYEFRIRALEKLLGAIKKYESEILKALKEDLGKSEVEAYTNEIGIVYLEIKHTLKHLKSWMKNKNVFLEIFLQPGKGKIYNDPYGNCLIIAPWNYPFQLMIAPLVAAISAGNTAIIKPSELAKSTEKFIEKIIGETFDEKFVKVVTGGVEETTELLKLPFDKIFFTGSVPVGKIVMEAAAKNLTPVTLELGGKSPTIVHKDANLQIAANKIVWGKFNNAGQTCVAPDYVLVHKDVEKELIDLMKTSIRKFYGENPKESKDYGRIINERNVLRLQKLINPLKVVLGGEVNLEEKFIEPTLMARVTIEDEVMKDEIFGPILPIIAYENIEDAIKLIRGFAKPLALYLFTGDENLEKNIMERVSFGGGGLNTTILHVASGKLPFGGVGPSGMGAYHGKAGFDDFTHKKSVLKQSGKFDLGLTYPGGKLTLNIIKKIM